MSSNHFQNPQSHLPSMHHSSMTQQYGNSLGGSSFQPSQSYVQMGLFGNSTHSGNQNLTAGSAVNTGLSNAVLPSAINSSNAATSTSINNMTAGHNNLSVTGHHYFHPQHQSQNHLHHPSQQHQQQQSSHPYPQASQQSHVTQLQQTVHPSQQQGLSQQYSYHVPQQNHLSRSSSNVSNHGVHAFSAIPPATSLGIGMGMGINPSPSTAMSPVSNSLVTTSKPSSVISKRSRKPRSKPAPRASSALEMDPSNVIFDPQANITATMTNQPENISSRLFQQFPPTPQNHSLTHVHSQVLGEHPSERQMQYQADQQTMLPFHQRSQRASASANSQHPQSTAMHHAMGSISHQMANPQISQSQFARGMSQGAVAPHQQQHSFGRTQAPVAVPQQQNYQPTSHMHQQHIAGSLPASSTGPVYECDGIQFRLLEDLAEVKVKRLRSEKIKPIEELTFEDIKAYNRNQLRAYCFVYGIKRKKKAEMEQNMARYASMFHPGDAAFDTSTFVPTDYLPGPIPRRKVPVTKEQKALSAGKFAARYLPAQRARPSVSGPPSFAPSIPPSNSSTHYNALHGTHVASSSHQSGIGSTHHGSHSQHITSHSHPSQHDVHDGMNGFHGESGVLVPPHNLLGDMGEE